jgi:hypothetical protein
MGDFGGEGDDCCGVLTFRTGKRDFTFDCRGCYTLITLPYGNGWVRPSGKMHFEQSAWPQFGRNHVRRAASSGISTVVIFTCKSYGRKHFVQ